MSKRKRMLLMLLGGGMTQSDIASIAHCSKRDVSAAARLAKERGLNVATVQAMDNKAVEELFEKPQKPREKNPDYLQPDLDALIKRKSKNKKIPVKLLWLAYCEEACMHDRRAYAYQTFCNMFSDACAKADATIHFKHVAAEKAFIDWAGDVVWVTDRISGKRAKAYLLIVCLPCSGIFFAEAFPDMKQDSWLKGHMDAFEYFGGAPQMLVPDNCATASDRSAIYITLVNKTYEAFAEHYGCAVVPARVRRPRDKSLAEGTVNLAETWIVAPANELAFHSLEELNDFVRERTDWLNDRLFSDKEGSRRSVYEQDESEHMLPLPEKRFETYVARRAKVSPDYHVRLDYMHYSVPFTLIGQTCDVRVYASKVVVAHGGEVVAEHARLHGRKGQYSTFVEHMPPNHRAVESPWSRARFESWASRIGPATAEAVGRMMDAKPIVQQSFVPCRNVLGLSKAYAPDLLERACASIVATDGALPSYTSVKNAVLAVKAKDAQARDDGRPPKRSASSSALVDRAKNAGRVQGADAWVRKEER